MITEMSLRASMADLKLRAKIIRKARGVGIVPGGPESVAQVSIYPL